MKKIPSLILVTFLSVGVSMAQQNFCYKMASYSNGSSGLPANNTPLLNVQIFNQPEFCLSYTQNTLNFQYIYDLAVGLSIAMAIIMFTYGAALGILEQGGVKSKVEGKDRMQNALVGLMIVLSTWLIINTVNPDLLRLPYFQNLDKLAQPKTTQSGGAGGVVGAGS